jgi:hypothetical protein
MNTPDDDRDAEMTTDWPGTQRGPAAHDGEATTVVPKTPQSSPPSQAVGHPMEHPTRARSTPAARRRRVGTAGAARTVPAEPVSAGDSETAEGAAVGPARCRRHRHRHNRGRRNGIRHPKRRLVAALCTVDDVRGTHIDGQYLGIRAEHRSRAIDWILHTDVRRCR